MEYKLKRDPTPFIMAEAGEAAKPSLLESVDLLEARGVIPPWGVELVRSATGWMEQMLGGTEQHLD